jgi:hypothetical protein
MGHVAPVQIGEKSKKTGKTTKTNRIWTAPCHDWTAEEQVAYMHHFYLPENPVKATMGISGECFCGAFASPGELDRLRVHAPDVAAEVDRLTEVATVHGTHNVWGTRPKKTVGVVLATTGMLCSGCDQRAAASGIVISRSA